MSSLSLVDISEQICYVQCGFCTTILLVSVPCNSMRMVVTVRCGHCTELLTVNMMRASFVPFHHFFSLDSNQNEQKQEEDFEEAEMKNAVLDKLISPVVSSDNEDEDIICLNTQFVNKPPEKRQRAPSAYNRFIREEIKRLKAENPNMAHKEAFSTAAKNWAQFPQIDQEDVESCDPREQNIVTWDSNVNKVHEDGKVFRESKLGHDDDFLIWPKITPF